MLDWSAAEPHCTPPLIPPLPTRVCHRTSPLRSGSTAWTTPDFCPATSARRPLAKVTRIGGEAKSKSGASVFVQLILSAMRQEVFQASATVTWWDQRILPESRSNAMNESLLPVGGSL